MTQIVFTCQQIVELVTEYFDGGLDADERLAFERHVAPCPPCRGYVSQMRKLSRSANGLREDTMPPELRAGLMQMFREWNDATAPR